MTPVVRTASSESTGLHKASRCQTSKITSCSGPPPSMRSNVVRSFPWCSRHLVQHPVYPRIMTNNNAISFRFHHSRKADRDALAGNPPHLKSRYFVQPIDLEQTRLLQNHPNEMGPCAEPAIASVLVGLSVYILEAISTHKEGWLALNTEAHHQSHRLVQQVDVYIYNKAHGNTRLGYSRHQSDDWIYCATSSS